MKYFKYIIEHTQWRLEGDHAREKAVKYLKKLNRRVFLIDLEGVQQWLTC